jgi:hypothetical protein
MVGDDDDLVFVPDLRGLAELAFEHADGARAANVVRHEHVGIHPDVVAGLHGFFSGGAREDFFSQRHSRKKIADARGKFNCGVEREQSGPRSDEWKLASYAVAGQRRKNNFVPEGTVEIPALAVGCQRA